MRTAYITHPDCLRHEMSADHPECPARLSAIQDQLQSAGLFDFLHPIDAPQATIEQLARAHDRLYIDEILAQAPTEGLVHIDPDTYMNPHTVAAALRAAGAVVQAVDLVLAGSVDNAFCAVRPPGHHAERHQAMGFCFFNNVAVGAQHALEVHDLERVAIVDFDVHHGNGTEDIFVDNDQVLLCSSYQHPFYPYSGRDSIPGHIVNISLGRGILGKELRGYIAERWLPELRAFKPQMLFISAGFDGHYEDDMANWNLIESDYAWITRELMAVAAKCANGRIVSVLEGGYALHALSRSAAAHIRVLMGL